MIFMESELTLKQWMEKDGRSAKQLADTLGVTVRAINHWLLGTRIPRPKQLSKINAISNGKVPPASFLMTDREAA